MKKLNAKQKTTLRAIFDEPPRSDVKWNDVVSLLLAVGADEIKLNGKARGSRFRFRLNGVKGLFHRPHPGQICDKGLVKSVRMILERGGITP